MNFTATSGGIAPTTTTAGATAQVPAGTTDAQGSAAAILSIAGDPSNRTITVSASTGGASAQVPVSVVGTQLTVTGPASLVMGAGDLQHCVDQLIQCGYRHSEGDPDVGLGQYAQHASCHNR